MTPQHATTLHELVRAAALRAPDSLAVVTAESSLTYRELDALADRYAAALWARGARGGARVVVWSDKSAAAIALTQGALRAGAVYVPVTSTNPTLRLLRIANDCAATVVVADDHLADRARTEPDTLAELPGTLCTFDELLDAAPADDPPPFVEADRDAPAYILYTSGSTGTPKGVSLSHRNALAFVDWAVDLVGVGPRDRIANHAPFNFDLSVFDLYAAFRAGASVHPVPAELAYAPAQLTTFIRENEISVWYSVPSALSLMMREGGLLDGDPPPDLRTVIFAGEPFAIQQVQRLRKAWPNVRLFNWYGPTETNVCTSYEVTEKDLDHQRPLPIGTAASGDTVTLDPAGEIVVTGPTVMLGYWGRPPHQGPYHTGDIGRYGPHGDLEYLGRLDHMVKIRGNRIELGEIETLIGAHPAIGDVAVVVVGEGLAARLHAVVTGAGAEPVPGLLAVKRWCADRLPTYMVVDAVHVVDALPLTANGKTDRSRLTTAIEEKRI